MDSMLNCQIRELYETGNMEPIQIAEALSLDENSVKMVLISSSSKFRKEVKENKTLFSTEDFNLARQKMAGLIFSELDNVAFRASRFIINENLGRNDIQQMKLLNINVS